MRPATFEIRSGEFRDLVARSREVVLLAAVTGALTGLLVRFFEYVVTEFAFDGLLENEYLHEHLWIVAIAPGLGLVASAIFLLTIGNRASAPTSDEYLRAYHDPE
jgi:CIC family chloride channel protein